MSEETPVLLELRTQHRIFGAMTATTAQPLTLEEFLKLPPNKLEQLLFNRSFRKEVNHNLTTTVCASC
ncbi:hypothetical protein DP113_27540 [Brasilonema octagenarum UFV-E1]|uniref:Uncharacterized protein n=2 Tax=Brasilonema TaxID=383614 RepID=A0A856MQ63_9CYAN|nr:hypothetical protein [Brasilonema octagenarum UFV-OR1]QDL11156.1 hypothetical protein DP114_27610 [Brasilonema sennae CENA114]QDL17502.1 hypothetical protein DP113_27540 [Brasilonema octagenarum UFV-E1]